jgi:hypothetical protein
MGMRAACIAAAMAGLMLLPADLCVVSVLALLLPLACGARAWGFSLLLLLTELGWVCLCVLFAGTGLCFAEPGLLFGGLALLVFSGVELACMALACCLWAQLTGQAALRDTPLRG